MDLAIDLTAHLRGPIATPGEAAEKAAFDDGGGLDWHGLHARCCAAHAARRVLGSADSPARHRSGGFGEWGAHPNFPEGTTPDVNPIDLAVLKLPAGKSDGVAQFALAGGRG